MPDGLEDFAALNEPDGRDPDLVALEEAAQRLHAKGVDFTVHHGEVVTQRAPVDTDRELHLDVTSHHIRLAIVSDTHLGSMHEQLTALRSFYRMAEDEGVQAFIHAGDMVQGSDHMHHDAYLSIHAHGGDAQMAYAVATYPRASVPTYVITGNHDDSYLIDGGMNIVRRIVAQRPDLVYLGQDAAYVNVEQVRAYVIHPSGGVPYAKSYRSQKLAENRHGLSLVVVGHLHIHDQFWDHGTLVLTQPCFQSVYPYLARKGLEPIIGGTILDLHLDDAGRIERMSTELVTYEPVVDDWDREASAAVARGWSDAA